MGQSPEELNTEIEQTRARMAADIDTLQDRVSPSAIVERRKRAARDRVGSVRDRVMGTAHDVGGSVSSGAGGVSESAQQRFEGNPIGAGLVAFGAGMVLASLLPATRAEAEAAHRVVETAREQGQPLVDQAREAGQQVASDLKDAATDAAQQVKQSAQESATTVQDEGRSAAQSVRDETTTS
ncbi:DUF3618 domain-containing protein [Nocardioides flavescens]|uniref:DUF3618 domain-containing protein n=1 Tax=Nocardioides flavescens TaxID=2691959 RepID=A0A6L7F3I9_9ACTN|nr:DUF3618 domain-containing protein [Nocardioides flavescens]MXG91803.1 DUF3618 domain-containing protein [Nocardioides flavescens]